MTEIIIKHKLENIQHIRAFAVVSVFLFHLGVAGFGWGFIGVDVFFVVSGYIMAMITTKRDFDFKSFLLRRVRRLVPVLLVMLSVVLLLGLLLQSNSELYTTSATALANFAALASFYISATTGYFDVAVKYRPLIHTWSLSIEWLCYFSLALILTVASQKETRAISAVAAVCAVYVLYGYFVGGGLDYYDVSVRAYLFFSGYLFFRYKEAVVFRLLDRKMFAVLSAGVFALVVAGLSENDWPNLSTLVLPLCVFPFFVINLLNASPRASAVGAYIGDISYSLYLWHWVVIWVLTVQTGAQILNLSSQFLAVSATVLLSVGSYHLLERNPFMAKVPVMAVAAVVVIGMASSHVLTGGRAAASVQYRLSNGISSTFNIRDMFVLGCSYPSTVLGPHDTCIVIEGDHPTTSNKDGKLTWVEQDTPPLTREEQVMVIGDSHSRHFVPVFLSEARIQTVHRLELSLERPESDFFIDDVLADEKSNFAKLKAYLASNGILKVFIAYRFAEKSEMSILKLANLIAHLSVYFEDTNVTFTMLRDIPSYRFDPVRCFNTQNVPFLMRACGIDLACPVDADWVANADRRYWDNLGTRMNTRANVKMIDTHATLCTEQGCRLSFGGQLVYRDSNHLNERLPDDMNKRLYDVIFGRSWHSTGLAVDSGAEQHSRACENLALN